jgi:hypothetical protein
MIDDMNVVSMLYRLARAAAWARPGSLAAQGRLLSLARRIRNRLIIARIVGPLLRK